MYNQNLMQTVLIGILLLCGYFYLFQAVAKRTDNKSSLPLIAVVLLLVYAFITIALLLMLRQLGNASFSLLAMLVLIMCLGIFAGIYGVIRHFREISRGMLLLFLLYLLMVGYVTIFSRSERRSVEILLRFDSIEEAIRKRSLEPLEHLLLNIAMFVPIGLLFALIWPGHTDKWRYVIPLGLMLTTLIETTQLMLRLGQCDLEDLVANTLGTCLGLAAYRIYRRFQPLEADGEDA